MVDAEILEPVKISGQDKETYAGNLEKSFSVLAGTLGSSDSADSSQAGYVEKIAKTVSLLKYNIEQENPANNTGIYTEMEIDGRFGLPSLESLVLFSSKAASADRELQRLGNKSDTAKKVIDVLYNWDPGEAGFREIQSQNDRIREIDFYRRLKNCQYADLPSGTSSRITDINLISENKQVENFVIFYAGWDIGKGFFCSYSIYLDDDKEKYMRLGPEKPGHIFRDSSSAPWQISQEVRSLLLSSFGLHPQHYFSALNELEGIHPQKIYYTGFEGFESRHAAKDFTEIIKRHQNSGLLKATTIKLEGHDVEGSGKTRQTKVDLEKDSSAALYIVCSEKIKSEVIEYYKHNKHVNFEILAF